MMQKKYIFTFFLLGSMFFSLSGCFVAPLLAPLSELQDFAAGHQRKYAMLQKRAGLFHEALRWQNMGDALAMVNVEAQQTFYDHFTAKKEKFVDFQIENIKLEADNTASVSVALQYVPRSRNIVETRQKREYWEFHRFSGGWLLSGIEDDHTNKDLALAQ